MTKQPLPSGRKWKIEDVVNDHIAECLVVHRNNIVVSAKALGIGRSTLYRWMQERKLKPMRAKGEA